MRRFSLVAAALLPVALGAQGLLESTTVISGPQYVNYQIGSGSTQKTVTQLSIPLAFIVPISESFSFDISGAWADSRVSSNGATSSKISGFTDLQARVNWSILDNSAVFTFGANLPTGMYKVPDGQQEAAGQIGSNFLLYPVSSMGSGSAYTGGLAFAKSWGEWNVGFGGSFRYSAPFDAYVVQGHNLRFEPGSESRVRLGLDRDFGVARVSLGATYSNFSDDKADSTTFATGARAMGQASILIPAQSGDWTLSGWDLYRAQGQQIGAVAPMENIANTSVAYGFSMGDTYVQPSLEGRFWMRDYAKAGSLGTAGVRLRFDWLGLSVNPAVSYSFGNVYPSSTGAGIDVKGLRATLLLRVN